MNELLKIKKNNYERIKTHPESAKIKKTLPKLI